MVGAIGVPPPVFNCINGTAIVVTGRDTIVRIIEYGVMVSPVVLGISFKIGAHWGNLLISGDVIRSNSEIIKATRVMEFSKREGTRLNSELQTSMGTDALLDGGFFINEESIDADLSSILDRLKSMLGPKKGNNDG